MRHFDVRDLYHTWENLVRGLMYGWYTNQACKAVRYCHDLFYDDWIIIKNGIDANVEPGIQYQ